MKSWLTLMLLGLLLLLAACGDDTAEPPTETDGAETQEEEVEEQEGEPQDG